MIKEYKKDLYSVFFIDYGITEVTDITNMFSPSHFKGYLNMYRFLIQFKIIV